MYIYIYTHTYVYILYVYIYIGACKDKKDKRKAPRPVAPMFAGFEEADAGKVAAPQLRTVAGRIVMDMASLVVTNATDKSHEFSDVVHDQVCFHRN